MTHEKIHESNIIPRIPVGSASGNKSSK